MTGRTVTEGGREGLEKEVSELFISAGVVTAGRQERATGDMTHHGSPVRQEQRVVGVDCPLLREHRRRGPWTLWDPDVSIWSPQTQQRSDCCLPFCTVEVGPRVQAYKFSK